MYGSVEPRHHTVSMEPKNKPPGSFLHQKSVNTHTIASLRIMTIMLNTCALHQLNIINHLRLFPHVLHQLYAIVALAHLPSVACRATMMRRTEGLARPGQCDLPLIAAYP